MQSGVSSAKARRAEGERLKTYRDQRPLLVSIAPVAVSEDYLQGLSANNAILKRSPLFRPVAIVSGQNAVGVCGLAMLQPPRLQQMRVSSQHQVGYVCAESAILENAGIGEASIGFHSGVRNQRSYTVVSPFVMRLNLHGGVGEGDEAKE